MSLLNDKEFLRLEKDFKFLSNARGNYKNAVNELESLDYVTVDIETTGLKPENSEIIEIGAFKSRGITACDVFNALIQPKNPIPKDAEAIHGISNDMVAGKPPIEEVLNNFLKFAGNSVLVAHNTDFDIGFIRYHLDKELGKELKNETICTVKLGRWLLPGLRNHKLPTIAEHLKIILPKHHRALSDAEATFHIWCAFIEMLKGKEIGTLKELKRNLDS